MKTMAPARRSGGKITLTVQATSPRTASNAATPTIAQQSDPARRSCDDASFPSGAPTPLSSPRLGPDRSGSFCTEPLLPAGAVITRSRLPGGVLREMVTYDLLDTRERVALGALATKPIDE